MARIKCPNCKEILEANETSPRLSCPNCGKTYKNPYYVDESAVIAKPAVAKTSTPQQSVSKPAQTVAKPIAQAKPVATKQATQATAKPAIVEQDNTNKKSNKKADQKPEKETRKEKKARKAEEAANNHSTFTGKLGSLIGLNITNALLIIFTLFIGTPLAMCRSYRWHAKNQVIDGQRLIFDGKAGQLLGQCFKWFFLTIITIGIYGLWVPLKREKWICEHTHFATDDEE